MANRFRGAVAGRSGRKIDFKQWGGIPSLSLEVNSDGTNSGGSIAFLEPATILRVRGHVMAAFDESKQVGDEILVTFGLGIISSDAFAAGPTAFPDPAGDIEYPWLWWGQMSLESYVTTNDEEAWGTSRQILQVDSKAMRKVKPSESLVWVVQTGGAVGAPVTVINFGLTRVLIGT